MPSLPDDLTQLSAAELKALQSKIEHEFARRAREAVIKKVEKLVEKEGLTLAQLFPQLADARTFRKKSGDAPAAVAAPAKAPSADAKYQHPEDASLTWSGKGHRPPWVKQWLADGGDLAKLKR